MSPTLIHVSNQLHAKSTINPNTLNLSDAIQIEVIIPTPSTLNPLTHHPLPQHNVKNSSQPPEETQANSNTKKPTYPSHGQPFTFPSSVNKHTSDIRSISPNPGSPPNIMDITGSNREGYLTRTQYQ